MRAAAGGRVHVEKTHIWRIILEVRYVERRVAIHGRQVVVLSIGSGEGTRIGRGHRSDRVHEQQQHKSHSEANHSAYDS